MIHPVWFVQTSDLSRFPVVKRHRPNLNKSPNVFLLRHEHTSNTPSVKETLCFLLKDYLLKILPNETLYSNSSITEVVSTYKWTTVRDTIQTLWMGSQLKTTLLTILSSKSYEPLSQSLQLDKFPCLPKTVRRDSFTLLNPQPITFSPGGSSEEKLLFVSWKLLTFLP